MPSKRTAQHEDSCVSKLHKPSTHQQNHHTTFHQPPPQHQPTSTPAYAPAVQQQAQPQPQQPPPLQSTLQQVPPTPITPGSAGSKKRTTGASSRTGQACDRCKTRKIRCDDTPGGCLPCRQNHTECTTTDRITNRPQVRGHTEAIEQEAAILRQHVADLQAQLKEHNLEPRISEFTLQQTWNSAAQATAGQASNEEAQGDQSANAFANPDSSYLPTTLPQEANLFAQTFTGSGVHSGSGRWVGISSSHADTNISPATGLSLSVFGMRVDLSQFVPQETNAKLSSISWDGIFKFISRGYSEPPGQPQPLARLPQSYEECDQHCRLYLQLINGFLPILDKLDFMALVRRFYTPSSRPSPAEKVQMQMVMCIVKFHMANRNPHDGRANQGLEAQSRAHLEFALQHVPQLTSRRTLADIQALALILMQLRNHPTPHACYFLTHWVSGIILDMGLHRSAQSRAMDGVTMTHKECEIRKRVFWSILGIMVTVSGKLGRPVELRSEDIDIEIPEPTDDLFPEETAKSPERRCSFAHAIESFKLLALFQDLYTRLYSTRPVGDYENVLRGLQARQKAWREQLPLVFRLGRSESEDPENRTMALWLAFWDAEIQLLLHHPAICRSVNPQIISTNIQQSVDASFRIIEIVAELRKAKANDTSWLNASTYIAAIFTLLFAYRQQMDEITPAEVNRLQQDLEACYAVLEDAGIPLGTGRALPDCVHKIVSPLLGQIRTYVESKHRPNVPNPADMSRQGPDVAAMQRKQAQQALQPQTREDQNNRFSPRQPPNEQHSSTPTHANAYAQQTPQQHLAAQPQLQQHTGTPTSYPIHQHQPPAQYNATPPAPVSYPQQPQMSYETQSGTGFMPYQNHQYTRPFQGAASNPAHAQAQQQNQAYLNHLNTVLAWNDMPGPGSTNPNTNGGAPSQQQWISYQQQPAKPQPTNPGSQWSQQTPSQPQQNQTPTQQHQQADYMGTASALMSLGTDPNAPAVNGNAGAYQGPVSQTPWPMSAGFMGGNGQNWRPD